MKKILIFAILVVAFGCKNENLPTNHLYISSAKVTDDLLISPDYPTHTKQLDIRLAQPLDRDVTVTIEAIGALAAEYNAKYSDSARALPETCYRLSATTQTIFAGTIRNPDPIVIDFFDTAELNRRDRYVLCVKITGVDGADLLASASTSYYVFKGAALVNVVADISRLKFPIIWSDAALPMVTGMTQLTVECLMRSYDWKAHGNSMGLGSLLGREGRFLIRMGDSGYTAGQPQIVGSGGGNWPSANDSPAPIVGEWFHFAFVLDMVGKSRKIYINGVEKASDNSASIVSSLSFPRWTSWTGDDNQMGIGYAYNDERYFPGEVAEYRIWNVARSADQLAENAYYLNVARDSDGLVAYWRFNEGAGATIKDYSGNGTDIVAEKSALTDNNKTEPVWNPVALPE